MRSKGPGVQRSVRTRPAKASMRPIRWCTSFTSKAGAAAIGCLLLALAPLEVEGQALEGCGVDLRGGVAIPVGDFRDEIGPGWTLGAALDCHARWPWTLRGGVELGVLSERGDRYLAQATALAGGELSVPVERWPMLLRARLEGGWTFPRWGGSFDFGDPARLRHVESGPVLAPGTGITLGSGDGLRARVDAGARVLFQNPDPEDQVPGGSGSDQLGFDRIVSFVLTVGFRL